MYFDKEKISEMMDSHYNWIVDMGYNNTSYLEKTILVYSEIGEASNELRGDVIKDGFGEELSDILLRIMAIVSQLELKDLFLSFIEESISYFENRDFINSKLTELEKIKYIIKPMNSAFDIIENDMNLDNPTNPMDFVYNLANVFSSVFIIALKKEVDIPSIINFKINKNINNGNKGRLK